MKQKQQAAILNKDIPNVESNGFYQIPNSMAIKAIHNKLTAADWALWSYLQMIDPFGDKMIELPKIPEIAEAIGVSSRQIKRSLSRLEELELYCWEPILVRGQNLAGKKAKELCNQKRIDKLSGKKKMTDLSNPGQSCPNDDRIVQEMTDLSNSGQNCPNRGLESLPDKGSNSPQTYSDFIQTLSEAERENFLSFCGEETNNLSRPINDLEAWLASTNKAGQNRWEVYHQRWYKQAESLNIQDTNRLQEFHRQIAEQERKNKPLVEERIEHLKTLKSSSE
ncbi:MAG: hypothetical protein ACFB02_07945 [Mastigocoleus sp.]